MLSPAVNVPLPDLRSPRHSATGKFLMWTENRFPNGYRYPFPPSPAEYAQALQEFLQNPPSPSADITPNSVGVALVQTEQRTQIGVFQPGH